MTTPCPNDARYLRHTPLTHTIQTHRQFVGFGVQLVKLVEGSPPSYVKRLYP